MKRRAFFAVLLAGLLLATAALAAGEVRQVLPVMWNSRQVQLRYVGSYYSVVKASGGDRTVLSSTLRWDSDGGARFGYVYAAKNGVVNLRMGPRPKASIVDKAKTNRLVLIFEQGEAWSGVLYNGQVGYLMNSNLKVIDPAEQPRGTAVLGYKGNTRRTTTVYMRMGPGTNTRKVVGLKPGAAVTVFGESGKWTEVEINGWRGYVLTEHLTGFEPLKPATPTDLPAEGPEEIVEVILLDD